MATGLVSRSDAATPLRELVGRQEKVQVLLGEVTTVNPEGKQIVFNRIGQHLFRPLRLVHLYAPDENP